MAFRESVSKKFEAYAGWLIRYRLAALIVSLSVVALLAPGMRFLVPDISFESFLHPDDPVRIEYDSFRDRFGREDAIVVVAETSDVFAPDFLGRLQAFHEDAIELPHVSDVTSLLNARDTRADGDTLRVGDLLEGWPLESAALEAARARALANPLYLNSLISPNAKFTSVRIDLDTYSSEQAVDVLGGFSEGDDPQAVYLTTQETDAFSEAFFEFLEEHQARGLTLYAAGLPVMLYSVSRALFTDMPRFVAFAFATIAVLLFGFFRRPAGVVLPLAVVGLSVLSTLGLMGHVGLGIGLPTQILPSMLLAIGVADAVHLLVIFFREFDRGASREESLQRALGHSAFPVLLTSITTAGGMASFAFVDIAPIAVLGVYAPIGVFFALFFSLTLLPALLTVVPLGRRSQGGRDSSPVDGVLVSLGSFATRHPVRVMVATTALCAIAALGIPRLTVSHNPPEWLPEGSPIRNGIEVIDQEMGGAMTMEVVVKGAHEGALRSPALLREMAELGESLEERSPDDLHARQTISLADIVKEIHSALNGGEPSQSVIPEDPELIAQELLLFESSGTDDLEKQVDGAYSVGRISVRLPWHDAVRYVDYIDAVEEQSVGILSHAGGVSLAGSLPLVTRAVRALLFGILESYGIALGVVLFLMALMLGSVRMGLYAMVPNVVPLLLTLGAMGWFSIPFDSFTMMTGGIALGLVVDDTIHFMHNFTRYHARSGDVESAVRETLLTAGRAIVVTSLTLGSGFLLFTLSSMSNLVAFGKVIAFAVGSALLADVLIAPALMALVVGNRKVAE